MADGSREFKGSAGGDAARERESAAEGDAAKAEHALDRLQTALASDSKLAADTSIPAGLQHESLVPGIVRLIVCFGVFAVLAFACVRWQALTTGQATHLPGLAMFVLFALGTLVGGSESVNLWQAFSKQRKSLLSPWATVIWSLILVVVVMVVLAALLFVVRVI